MGMTTFDGPVRSLNGFVGQVLPAAGGVPGPGVLFAAVPTASLPPATIALKGAVMCVSDNGAGNNEVALVLCNGVAWTLTTGAALT
jgi:hypothetical protein